MSLQSGRLVMLGLGIEADPRPVAEQERLIDGVHLRWSPARDSAFPWHGYFLFRREQLKTEPVCLAPHLRRKRPIIGKTTETFGTGPNTFGTVSSESPLLYRDDFSPTGELELDLESRRELRVALPNGQHATQVDIAVGFRETKTKTRCLNFLDFDDGFHLRDDVKVTFERATKQGRAGQDRLQLTFQTPVSRVDIDGDNSVSIEMVSLNGKKKSLAKRNEKIRAQTFIAREDLISTLIISGTRGWFEQRAVRELCYTPASSQQSQLTITFLDTSGGNDHIIHEEIITGTVGDIRTLSHQSDRINAIKFSAASASLINVCYYPIVEQSHSPWEPVPRCPQPLTLPSRHPDYPAWTGTIDTNVSETTGTSRIRYGNPANWSGPNFAELHSSCIELVTKGPSVPMAAAARSQNSLPSGGPAAASATLRSTHPLDRLLLGALHPAIAEMLGLAWVDETAVAGTMYDYMIVAEHADISGGDPKQLLTHLQTRGHNAGTDAWICHGLSRKHSGILPALTDTKAYALPGGYLSTRIVAGNVGLTWPNRLLYGLQPDEPVMHHVWREDAGKANLPVFGATAPTWLTAAGAIIRTHPSVAPITPSSYPNDWPPFRLQYIDVGLDEGWYGYQVSGVDLFGRYSPKTDPVSWWSWDPPPNPRPWYPTAAGATEIHPDAVRVLNTRRPPAPIIRNVTALDPTDSTIIRDAPYNAWFQSLPRDRQKTIGLLVEWSWPANLARQAPDVNEFRLYWNDGQQRPTDWENQLSWTERFHVCAINDHVTVLANGDRLYQLFLPGPGGQPFGTGIPLTPTATNPLRYANITVTAADPSPAFADTRPGAARPGKESTCGAPRPIVTVYREPPRPPEPVIDGERVYATAADWYSRSYYAVRWQAQPGLKAHIWRAVDDAVFANDWKQQPRSAIAPNDPAFPDPAAEPRWNTAKRTLIAAELNEIRAVAIVSRDESAKTRANSLYRALSDDALRVLANLPGSGEAFMRLTNLAVDETTHADKRAPSDPAAYVARAGVNTFIDELDGRATNRYLYRTSFINAVHSQSVLGAPGTCVRLPNVVAPNAPRITKVLGGERSVTIEWVTGRETDLAEYRLYRTFTEGSATDPRTMSLVTTIAVDSDVAARPKTTSHIDVVPGRIDVWYVVVAVDRVGIEPAARGANQSQPSTPVRARAYDTSTPSAPAITSAQWVRRTETGTIHPWTDPESTEPWERAIELEWDALEPGSKTLLQHRADPSSSWSNASSWLDAEATSFVHRNPPLGQTNTYRLKIRNSAGSTNTAFTESDVSPP